MCKFRLNRKERGSSAAELPVALMVLFFFALFPLFNLFMLVSDAAIIALFSHQLASDAAVQSNYDRALTKMVSSSSDLNNSRLAGFAHLQPNGGFRGSGSNLYIVSTDYINQGVTTIGPNVPLAAAIEPSKFVYEFMVTSRYTYEPIFNLSSVPFIGTVPGIGKPFTLSMSAFRSVEHLDGLRGAPKDLTLAGNNNALDISRNTGVEVPGELTETSDSGWNYPGLYNLISQSGQKVLNENVLLVNATDNWVYAGVNANPGQTIWIDTRAVGRWAAAGSGTNPHEADGDQGAPDGPNGIATGTVTGLGRIFFNDSALWGSLIGFVGSTPPYPQVGQPGLTLAQNPGLFAANKTMFNYTPTTSGPVNFIINDTLRGDNVGLMSVRVIIAIPK